MANLLYITKDVLKTLRKHPAYLFWNAIVQNFPIRITPLEERSFHPRLVKVEENAIYLTVDMKFVYCRENLFSFLYETQDLSFRLTAKDGILRTLDNKQFTALIGKVAVAVGTSEIELVNQDKLFHPTFDQGLLGVPAVAANPEPAPAAAEEKAPSRKAKAKTREEKAPVQVNEVDLILDKYPKNLCDEIVNFRESSKKSYAYLADRFNLARKEVKDICDYYKQAARSAATSEAVRESLRSIPKDMQETIVRMKKVSKKSYEYLAKKFDLSVETIQDICAQYLKRPRKRKRR